MIPGLESSMYQLFPELRPPEVYFKDGVEMTHTLAIAKRFKKSHGEVMRITRVVKEYLDACKAYGDFSEQEKDIVYQKHYPSFTYGLYIDSRGRKQPMYEMNVMAFRFLVHNLEGEEVMAWMSSFFKAYGKALESVKVINQETYYVG